MKCPQCQSDNREGVKFCEECGAKMEMTCANCGAKLPLGKKFCGECATPLPGIQKAVHTKTLETPTEELTRGSVFAGRYEIIEELGKGGMGKVYRVEDTKIKKELL